MKSSQYFFTTLKETPANAEVVSHQLMLRAGMIRLVSQGLYTWLPLGLRVLRKVEAVVREEMNRAGSLEMLMPAIQPAELWQETGRWGEFGDLMLRMQDRHERDYCFGPTHEEVITDLVRQEVHSYKQLPLNFYQIQTKFRDELRPRFGVMRAREFVMKDAYSFHTTVESLQETYQVMYDAYARVFTRLGLRFRAVEADSGSIGGSYSHEFQVLADAGEDIIAYSDMSNYAANIERAESLHPSRTQHSVPAVPMGKIDTPGLYTIKDIVSGLNVGIEKTVKTLLVEGVEHSIVAIILCGDDMLNTIKAEKHPLIKAPLTPVSEEVMRRALGVGPGSLGPVGLCLPILVDHCAFVLDDFVCGANEDDKHFIHVDWARDCPPVEVVDFRNVKEGDPSPDGKGTLKLAHGIEVGHVFQLGDKYSKAMNAAVMTESGKPAQLYMGSYGIGVSRIVAAAIEQHHDEHGIIWPEPMAPFQVVLIPVQYQHEGTKRVADDLYAQLLAAGIDVLLDDRPERPGVKFAEMDLIGIPHRIVIGEKGIARGMVEYKCRADGSVRDLAIAEVVEFLIDH